MKKLIFLFSLTVIACCGQAITAGSVFADNIGHTTLRINFVPTGPWSSARVRVVPNSTSCSGGSIIGNSGWQGWGTGTNFAISIFGLTPATNYEICPEISNNGTSFVGGVGVNITTDALPAQHPLKPIAPERFDTNYPDTTGYRTITVTSNDDCSSIMNAMNWAINDPGLVLAGDTNACHDQTCRGVVINIPAGSTCTGRVYTNTVPLDVKVVPNSNFNTANSQITMTGHHLTEGQVVTWAVVNRSVFGQPWSGIRMPNGGANDADSGHPFNDGDKTYVHYIDANTFQIYANAPYGTACTPGHSLTPCPVLWQFKDQGDGAITYAPWYNTNGHWERNLKWIILRTATPDLLFVPEHVRLQGPKDATGKPTEPSPWRPKMATLQLPKAYVGVESNKGMLFSTYSDWENPDGDSSVNWRASHIRLVGLELTYEKTPMDAYVHNPGPGFTLIWTGGDTDNIIVDRCWIHGWPAPSRVYKLLRWNGKNEAFVDSYFNNMLMPRQFREGLWFQ